MRHTIVFQLFTVLLGTCCFSLEAQDTLPVDTRPLTAGKLDEGKAEFNVYDATIMRHGHLRDATVTHIWVKEPWDAGRNIKWGGEGQGDFEVIKLNQVISYQTGMYRYEQMWSGFWKRDSADLLKFSLTHHESCGNTYKQARLADGQVDLTIHSYVEGEGDSRRKIDVPENALFYDELPLRLRLIVFRGLSAPVTVPLFPATIHSRAGSMESSGATIRQTRRGKGELEFEVKHSAGTDRFVYETAIPFKLLRWQQADGSQLKLRQSLFTDYWNHNKPDDEESLN